MNCVLIVKLRVLLPAGVLFTISSGVFAQESGRNARRLAERNELASPREFTDIFSGRTDKLWCGAFYSGLVSALGIVNDRDCFIMIDVAGFTHESIWHTTSMWLNRQPDSLRISYYGAVYRGLSERESCDL